MLSRLFQYDFRFPKYHRVNKNIIFICYPYSNILLASSLTYSKLGPTLLKLRKTLNRYNFEDNDF